MVGIMHLTWRSKLINRPRKDGEAQTLKEMWYGGGVFLEGCAHRTIKRASCERPHIYVSGDISPSSLDIGIPNGKTPMVGEDVFYTITYLRD